MLFFYYLGGGKGAVCPLEGGFAPPLDPLSVLEYPNLSAPLVDLSKNNPCIVQVFWPILVLVVTLDLVRLSGTSHSTTTSFQSS